MTQKYQVKVSMKQAAIVETGIVLKQGDFGMQIEIEVLDFDATGTTPQIVFRKAMGAVESTTITVSGNKYTYIFKGTELDTPGKCFCDLKLKNSTTQRISTASFMFRVIADTMDGLNEQASSYSDTIAQIVGGFDDEIEDLQKSIQGSDAANDYLTDFILNYGDENFFDNTAAPTYMATRAKWLVDLRGYYVKTIKFNTSTGTNPAWTTATLNDDGTSVTINESGWKVTTTDNICQINRAFDSKTFLCFRDPIPYSNHSTTENIGHPLRIMYADATTGEIKYLREDQNWLFKVTYGYISTSLTDELGNEFSIFGDEINQAKAVAPFDDLDTFPMDKVYRVGFQWLNHSPVASGGGIVFGWACKKNNKAISCQFAVVSQSNEMYFRTWFNTPGAWVRLADTSYVANAISPVSNDVSQITNILNHYGEILHFTDGASSVSAPTGENWVMDFRGMYIDHIDFDKTLISASQNPLWTTGTVNDQGIVTVDTDHWRRTGETVGSFPVMIQFDRNTVFVFRGGIPYSVNGATTNFEKQIKLNYVDRDTGELKVVGAGTQSWICTVYYKAVYYGIPTSDENRFQNAPCDFSLFSNFGVIGDSYTCGGAWNNEETAVIDGFEQSWGAILGRRTGAEAHIFGISGSTTASWLADTGARGLQGMLNDDPLQLYILGHVINDANTHLTIGNIEDLEGVDDPTSLPSTFINNQAKIMYYCKQHSPNAKIIFMLSDGYLYNNIDKSAYDAATIQVANFYGVPYINQHDHPFYLTDAYKSLTKGHPRAQGYSVMAKAIRQLIEDCMSKTEYLNYFNTSYIVDT